MRLPYKPNDDGAADKYINIALRSQNKDAWTVLFSDEYVVQTYRILSGMKSRSTLALADRNRKLEVLRQQRRVGEVSTEEYTAALEEYGDWKVKAQHFLNLVTERLMQAKPLQRRVSGDDKLTHFAKLVDDLIQAIQEHRRETEARADPTVADRMLWLRLTTLRFPDGQTLAERG